MSRSTHADSDADLYRSADGDLDTANSADCDAYGDSIARREPIRDGRQLIRAAHQGLLRPGAFRLRDAVAAAQAVGWIGRLLNPLSVRRR